jgi:hypothetical protein
MRRKTVIEKYAIGELKYDANSRRPMAQILAMLRS